MRWTGLFIATLCGPMLLLAQQATTGLPVPRLTTAFPAGGKAGTTVEVVLTGSDLDEPQALYASHPGIKGELVPVPPPPPPDPKKPAPKMATPTGPPTTHKFKITVAADVPVGSYDIRFVGKWGVSNPRTFAVSNLNEFLEKEPNNDVPEAQKVEIGSVINGIIGAPTDVDIYSVTGKKGQRVVFHLATTSIDGRASPAIWLYSPEGKQLAFSRDYNENDALTDYTFPADGEIIVRVSDFTYLRGGPDAIYRLSISSNPWIDAVFPNVVEAGKTTAVTVIGRNLPGGKLEPSLTIDGVPMETMTMQVTAPPVEARHRLAYSGLVLPRGSSVDGFELRVGSSLPFLMQLTTDPVVLEKEPNNTPELAQAVPSVCEVAGRIDSRGDKDFFAVTLKKGEPLMLELIGERVGSPTNLFISVRAADKPNALVEQDDIDDVLHPSQFFTRTLDPSAIRFVPPADGKYLVQVGARDSSGRFGPRQAYRLRVGPERPDFRLIAMPACLTRPEAPTLRAGGTELIDVFVWRMDGYNGPVQLSAEGLPPGVTCPPAIIGTGMKQGWLVLSATPEVAAWTGNIRIQGTATINGKPVVREARPATLTYTLPQPQNLSPGLCRLDRTLVLAIRDKTPLKLDTNNLTQVTLKAGDKTPLAFKIERILPELKVPVNVSTFVAMQNVNPNNLFPLALPPGSLTVNNNAPITIAPDKNEGTANLEAKPNTTPGVYNVVLRAAATYPKADYQIKGKPVNVTVTQYSLPITVTVVPTLVAKLSVVPPSNVKVGNKAEVVVKVDRQFDYAGEFKVTLVPPANTPVTATEVTIPAGQNEVKLLVDLGPDAKPGNLQNLVVRAVAVVTGKIELTHETKFNLNVVK